jgi:hypothetical protein
MGRADGRVTRRRNLPSARQIYTNQIKGSRVARKTCFFFGGWVWVGGDDVLIGMLSLNQEAAFNCMQ